MESLSKELRDRFGPVPPAVEFLLQVAELKLLASQKEISAMETKGDKLILTRNNDYITLSGKFPRLTKATPKARLKEIRPAAAQQDAERRQNQIARHVSQAPDAARLQSVYRELGTRLARDRKRVEVTSAFAAGGAVLLLIGSALSSLWFRRAL